jgi:hypothetical protein
MAKAKGPAQVGRPSDLIGYPEVARMLGVAVKSVRQRRWRATQGRGSFPEPATEYGGSPVWRRSTIAKLVREQERREQALRVSA